MRVINGCFLCCVPVVLRLWLKTLLGDMQHAMHSSNALSHNFRTESKIK